MHEIPGMNILVQVETNSICLATAWPPPLCLPMQLIKILPCAQKIPIAWSSNHEHAKCKSPNKLRRGARSVSSNAMQLTKDLSCENSPLLPDPQNRGILGQLQISVASVMLH